MFNNLASLLGFASQNQATEPVPAEASLPDQEVDRLQRTPVDDVIADDDDIDCDDWVLVEQRNSEGDTELSSSSSLESIPERVELPHQQQQQQLTRTSSTSSLPCKSFEESWFLTPPPCFTSAGPINMETSPMENLLIEHPSMSVYQHHHHHTHRRFASAPSSPGPASSQPLTGHAQTSNLAALGRKRATVTNQKTDTPRKVTAPTLRQQQEKQCLKIKNAQKVEIHKACQSLKRGYFERNNKAREVNCRNRRQRRGERSQGAARSNANNNRKC